MDASGWSGEGELTQRLIDAIAAIPPVQFLKVEDAPASRADGAFSFISNELFVRFESVRHVVRTRALGLIPRSTVVEDKLMTLGALESSLSAIEDLGPPDYSDEGMLQYLRTQQVVQPYQTRAYKLIELVRIYEAGSTPRRDA